MTPAEIAALSPADRTQLFRRLAEARYGERKTLDLCGEEMGYGRRTVYDWVDRDLVPLPVLFALTAWAEVQALATAISYLSERP